LLEHPVLVLAHQKPGRVEEDQPAVAKRALALEVSARAGYPMTAWLLTRAGAREPRSLAQRVCAWKRELLFGPEPRRARAACRCGRAPPAPASQQVPLVRAELPQAPAKLDSEWAPERSRQAPGSRRRDVAPARTKSRQRG
jgi:hypothetical protein